MNEKQKKISLVLLILCISISGAVAFSLFQKKRPYEPVFRVEIGEKVFELEVAQTPEEHLRGLGKREEICSQCGMLFLFEKPEKQAFWMKDMRFPIDIVWLSGDKVVYIERAIPADSPHIFSPPEPADRVLEFNAGATAGLKTGERIEFFH